MSRIAGRSVVRFTLLRMSDPYDDLPFNGLTSEQRLQAALKQTTAVMKALAPFLVTLQPGRAPDPKLQREAVSSGLGAVRDLLKTLILDELFAASGTHKLGDPPPVNAPENAHNLRAIKELHLILDWLAEIAPRDSIDAGRADLRRLEDGEEPLTLRLDKYKDRRRLDHTELADRATAVLLVRYLAAKGKEKIPNLLERLGTHSTFFAYEKWAKKVTLQQRRLMTAAGKADREGRGMSLEQLTLLSKLPRCLAVLNRHNAEMFPDLAGLSDEDMVRKLFDRAQRRRQIAR